MASEKKLTDKLEKLQEKAKNLLTKHGELKRSAGKIPAPAMPVVSGASAAIGAYADGRMGTADNKHPGSIALAGIQWAGALVTAFMGHATTSQLLSGGAGGNVAFLAGSAAYDRGVAAKAKD